MKPAILIISCLYLLSLVSCTAKRYIPEDKQLFTGHKVVYDSMGVVDKQKRLRKEIIRILQPKPNFSILGSRPSLWLYYQVKDTTTKGIKNFIKNTLGSPPVYTEDVDAEGNSKLIEDWLENKGFFEREVTWSYPDSGKTTPIEYLVDINSPYVLKTVNYISGDSPADTAIKRIYLGEESLITQGCPYSLKALKDERIRINDTLRNNGYFFFAPDYLLFNLDTAEEGRNTELYLKVKEETPEKALIPYTLSRVIVHSGFKLGGDTLSETVPVGDKGIEFIYYDSTFRANPILKAISIAPGQLYSREQHEITLGRLVSMGAFRFVDISYVELDTVNDGNLVAHIYLSPMLQHTIRTELKFVTKSNNFTGPSLNLSYRNRNTFKGAELYVASATIGYEVQFGGRSSDGINSYELSLNNDLYLPRSISLFKGKRNVNKRMPRTHYNLGASALSRLGYFSMYALNASYGYNWQPKKNILEELKPITFSFVNVFRVSDEFEEILSENPMLERSFEKQFIIGPEYIVTFNNQLETDRRVNFFARFTIGESGLLTGIFNPELNGVPVSQYTRTDLDFRQYWSTGRESKVVTRIFMGVGLPYGNSLSMPYLKQYFSGGANSIRAFPARTVGPGSYTPPDSLFTELFIDQSGDIKLEGNIEYRFPISSILKGAVFLDGGNVWLRHPDAKRPGAEFDFRNISRQLAVGYGFGLRFDVTFFVLRFDLGIPLRRPYNESDAPIPHRGSGPLGDMVLNVAIGYPF